MTAANKHNVYNPSKLDSTYLRIHLFFTKACSNLKKAKLWPKDFKKSHIENTYFVV